jgi:hypothetical protein
MEVSFTKIDKLLCQTTDQFELVVSGLTMRELHKLVEDNFHRRLGDGTYSEIHLCYLVAKSAIAKNLKISYEDVGVELVAYQNQDLVYADLVSGRVDTAFQDAVTAGESFLNKPQGEQFEYAGPEVSDEKYFGVGAGIGVRKEDGALKDALNKTLAEMRKDGTYDTLAKKYFKFNIYGE